MAFIKEGSISVRSRIEDMDENGLVTDGETVQSESEGFVRFGEDEVLIT